MILWGISKIGWLFGLGEASVEPSASALATPPVKKRMASPTHADHEDGFVYALPNMHATLRACNLRRLWRDMRLEVGPHRPHRSDGQPTFHLAQKTCRCMSVNLIHACVCDDVYAYF